MSVEVDAFNVQLLTRRASPTLVLQKGGSANYWAVR